MRSAIYNSLPSGFQQLGETSIYYNVSSRPTWNIGYKTGYSILGKIGNQYYSSTYESWGAGAGFIAAFQVNNNSAVYVNADTGTSNNGVDFTTDIQPQGDVAARIIYTVTNNTDQTVTINAGVWADIMIGDNDRAPLERLKNSQEAVYGIKMKYSTAQGAPLLCALFGEGVTGVTPVDDYWFGNFSYNDQASEIVGNYETNFGSYMQENGSYDSGLGFCWKGKEIQPGESIELSYLISVGEIDIEEPIVPGEDRFEYEVEAFDFDGWNDLNVAHPAHIWGYYEHPYGQEGYIEYQVDDENTWHRIPTALVSGENFDLPFDMMFNSERDTDHVLALRFNDGLDNTVDLDGLRWIDVRSIPVTGLEERVYNGEAQTYEVTVGDNDPIIIGEDGAYINPGVYNFTVEGVFAENTIGVNVVEFEIVKGQAVIDVDHPESVEYDGQAHGATVEVIVGDNDYIVTYVNVETGEVMTEAPVEIGVYEVFVEVLDSELYNGIEKQSYGEITIYRKHTAVEELTIDSEDNGAWYTIDGIRVNAPTQRGIYIHNGKKVVK
ncbi:MAG: hypothetical protein IKI10_00135 [Muribaculaceae bacterium]|nr:hypothetical protein [Muribaculaceae bacterium]